MQALQAPVELPPDKHLVFSSYHPALQQFYPQHMALNGQPCTVTLSLNLTAPVPTFATNGSLVEDSPSPISATLGQLTGAHRCASSTAACMTSCALFEELHWGASPEGDPYIQ